MAIESGLTIGMEIHPNVNMENMKIWVDGLLSNEFTQGQGHLGYIGTDSDGEAVGPTEMCCLGVACELALRHHVQLNAALERRLVDFVLSYDGERDFLPPAVQEWLGLDSPNPLLLVDLPDGGTDYRAASFLNDGEAESGQRNENGGIRYLPRYGFRAIAKAVIRTFGIPGYEHLLEEGFEEGYEQTQETP